MLDYARQRAVEALSIPRKAVLVTQGPAGLQAGEFPCEAQGLLLYLLVPATCDHLFNLEQNASVTLVSSAWELNGSARVISPHGADLQLALLEDVQAEWCRLVCVEPGRMHLLRQDRWGRLETLDLEPET